MSWVQILVLCIAICLAGKRDWWALGFFIAAVLALGPKS